jgi:hypothetical protein
MTIENNDKQKATVDSAQQQPQTVQQAGQQQKQASPHDEKTCTNPDPHHGKEKTVSDATKPNQDGKPAR